MRRLVCPTIFRRRQLYLHEGKIDSGQTGVTLHAGLTITGMFDLLYSRTGRLDIWQADMTWHAGLNWQAGRFDLLYSRAGRFDLVYLCTGGHIRAKAR